MQRIRVPETAGARPAEALLQKRAAPRALINSSSVGICACTTAASESGECFAAAFSSRSASCDARMSAPVTRCVCCAPLGIKHGQQGSAVGKRPNANHRQHVLGRRAAEKPRTGPVPFVVRSTVSSWIITAQLSAVRLTSTAGGRAQRAHIHYRLACTAIYTTSCFACAATG